jgi:hypothetical protein
MNHFMYCCVAGLLWLAFGLLMMSIALRRAEEEPPGERWG